VLGIVKVVTALFALVNVREPVTTSHLTNLLPPVGEAVIDTEAPLIAAAEVVGFAVPIVVLLDVTVI